MLRPESPNDCARHESRQNRRICRTELTHVRPRHTNYDSLSCYRLPYHLCVPSCPTFRQILLRIFGDSLSSLTTTRERLNDLCSLALVCRAFRGPAQAALFGAAAIRAAGRATLLLQSIESSKNLASSCSSISWCSQTRRASHETLAALLAKAHPVMLALGSGFFSRTSSDEVNTVENALRTLGPHLRSFAFGGYDLESTSSDFVTHLLSSAFVNLTSLDLRQVRFQSPHLGSIETAHDSFWRCYPRPQFALKHLSISFVRPMPASRAREDSDEQEQSWLHWLLAGSTSTLVSLDLANLADSLPEDALQLLDTASSRLRSLSITEYEGEDLLADLLVQKATQLVALTLGGLASVALPQGMSMDVLASKAIWEGRHQLRYLEIQNLQLFERLGVLKAMKAGQLPSLRQIVLTNASRIHPKVQLLDAHCTTVGISLLVKR